MIFIAYNSPFRRFLGHFLSGIFISCGQCPCVRRENNHYSPPSPFSTDPVTHTPILHPVKRALGPSTGCSWERIPSARDNLSHTSAPSLHRPHPGSKGATHPSNLPITSMASSPPGVVGMVRIVVKPAFLSQVDLLPLPP